MTIATGQTITKTDVVNGYNNKVQNIINLINWSASAMPKFSGTDGAGLANPNAVPNGQLSSTQPQKINNNQLSNTILANELYNLFYNTIQDVTRVRLCSSYWYFNTNGTNALVNSQVNKYANFNATTSVVSGTTTPYFTKSPNNTNMMGSLSLGRNNINQNVVVAASNVNAIINELYNNWNTWKNSNKVTFNYYTCHSNCHSNYDNRARR